MPTIVEGKAVDAVKEVLQKKKDKAFREGINTQQMCYDKHGVGVGVTCDIDGGSTGKEPNQRKQTN